MLTKEQLEQRGVDFGALEAAVDYTSQDRFWHALDDKYGQDCVIVLQALAEKVLEAFNGDD